MTPDDDDGSDKSEREAAPAADRDHERDRDQPRDREPARDHRDHRDHRDQGRERDRDRGDADGLGESIRQRLEHLVPELVKKTFAAGMGAVFSTEEGIRKFAREVNIPTVAGYIADSADGAKDKVFEVIARETREFLANLNIGEEVAKLLTTLSFEIKTEIRFIPNSERFTGTEPDVKASVRLKRTDRPDDKTEDRKDDRKAEPEDAREEGEGRESRSRLRFWRRDGAAEGDGDDTPDK
ncbi:MAG: hypothetical protein H0T79_07580 [Deltaproteobacteria bacterium]|nr:hypothetical protein [Deltaproteobacteria bacterium]